MHALTRETVYADLPAGQRARWHAVVGRTLAERLAADPELLGDVAHHHAVAATYLPETAEAAVDYGRQAAVAAERRGAFDEARSLWSRTVEVERSASPPDPLRRHELLLALATARQRLGDMHGMRTALDEAVALARPRGDYVRMAEALTSFRSSGVWHWREMGDADDDAIALIEECLEHVDDIGLRARLLATLGLEHYVAMDAARGDVRGGESLRLARESGDPDVLRDCLAARSVAVWSPVHSGERVSLAEEALTAVASPEHEISARFQLATGLHHLGRAPEADAVMTAAFALADRLRHTGSDVPLGWWRWLRAVEREDPEAERIGHETLALHRRTTVVGLAELSCLYTLECQPRGAPVPADVLTTAMGHPFPPFRAAVAHALSMVGDLDGGAAAAGRADRTRRRLRRALRQLPHGRGAGHGRSPGPGRRRRVDPAVGRQGGDVRQRLLPRQHGLLRRGRARRAGPDGRGAGLPRGGAGRQHRGRQPPLGARVPRPAGRAEPAPEPDALKSAASGRQAGGKRSAPRWCPRRSDGPAHIRRTT